MGNQHSQLHTERSPMQEARRREELNDRTPTQLAPIDKLAKILVQKSLEEDSVQGITCNAFARYVFPRYPDLAERLFTFFLSSAGPSKHNWLSQSAFKVQAERFLGIITDEAQISNYVKMYSDNDGISQENFRQLLIVVNKLAMDHYPDGPVTCLQLYQTLQAVIDSAFHRKSVLPLSYLANWISINCPRLTFGIHRYVIHMLSTAHRAIGQTDNEPAGLELSTPVLEREVSFGQQGVQLLPVSQVWILATVLPQLYIQPSQHHSPASCANGLSSQNFVAKMLGSICPSHWALLYDSNQHGLGANRFMHHVLSYRGPTLTLIRGDQGVQFCIASDVEWKESHQYRGSTDCILLQMLPLFHVIEKGEKMLFLNGSIRGYPKGLRAGSDPRKPAIDVNDGFSIIKYRDIPYSLHRIEVWGCGTEQSRQAQLEMKRWQVKEAEKQRQVKLRAEDWVDHPDRYLLELAGRQTYSQKN